MRYPNLQWLIPERVQPVLRYLIAGWLSFAVLELQAAPLDPLTTPSRLSVLASSSLLLDITRAGEQRLVAVGERGHIIRSDDFGESWQQAQVPVSVNLTAVFFADAEQGWAVGHDGVVLHSDDGGRNWSLQLDGNQINELVVEHYQALLAQVSLNGAEIDLETLEIALEDALFASEDGPTRPLLDLYFADSSNGWVIGAYGLLLRTNDGGQNWQPAMLALDNPDGFHLNAIGLHQGELLIAGEAGVLFRSEQQGEQWQRLDAGYEGPYFSVTALGQSGQLLLSGLRGRLFSSTDGGDSWQALETPTRSTFNAATPLIDGGLVAVGNGGVLLHLEDKTDLIDQARVHVTNDRQSYTAVIETDPGQLVLVGQKGVSRIHVDQITGGVR